MRKTFLAILFGMLSFTIIINYTATSEKAYAQNSQSNSSNMVYNIPDFSTKGTVDTMIFLIINNTLLDPQDKSVLLYNITEGLASGAKSLIDGNWTLDVKNGTVEEFDANLSSINADASNYHTHSLSNFTSNANPEISITPNGTINIKGQIDVGLNGETVWKKVKSDFTLYDNKTIMITLDDSDTDNHFAHQQIYGKVKSWTN